VPLSQNSDWPAFMNLCRKSSVLLDSDSGLLISIKEFNLKAELCSIWTYVSLFTPFEIPH